MRSTRQRAARRGVLLLIILSLLAMFALVAIAFVILTGQFRRSSEAVRRIERFADPPRELLDEAFAQLVRGTNNPASAVGPHSLLEDMYGAESMVIALPNASWGANAIARGGQLISVPATQPTPPITTPPWTVVAATKVGCVMTMLDGPFAGKSTRIVHYVPSTNQWTILPFEGVPWAVFNAYVNTSRANRRILINGAPFSGTGAGQRDFAGGTFDGRLNRLSLIPNAPAHLLPPLASGSLAEYAPCGSPGGANEDYDAPDHQNMFLAMMIPGADRNGQPINGAGSQRVTVPIPSFHRADLAAMWVKVRGGTPTAAAALSALPAAPASATAPQNMQEETRSRVVLRPNQIDHPDFTGSNPTFSPSTTGSGFNPFWDGRVSGTTMQNSWDVDNDGDGVPDSVWLDLGMPVRATEDGRVYKPLFAILCTDLDGRLNLNAQGCVAQGTGGYYGPVSLPAGGAYAGGTSTLNLRRGMGFGPAEINLAYLFNTASGTPNFTTFNRVLRARYGDSADDSLVGSAVPGIPNVFAAQWRSRQFEYMGNYAAFNPWPFYGGMGAYRPDAYRTPPDFFGDSMVAIDPAGRPFWYPQAVSTAAFFNTPYEMNLDHAAAWRRDRGTNRTVDNPFTPAELERLLRATDGDQNQLPDRLMRMSSPASDPLTSELLHLAARNSATTESWDVPVPAVFHRPQGDSTGATSALERMRNISYRLYRATGSNAGVWQSIVHELLAPDILAGRRMDINWPFGNGLDNNGNGVVDDPAEISATTTEVGDLLKNDNQNRPVNYSGIPFDPTAKGLDTTHRALAREHYARYLYCLASLVLDAGEVGEKLLPTSEAAQTKGARALAQWAVNVVDFRDRDSIMTRLRYDPAFGSSAWMGTWTPTETVWGCERPSLVISETLALHDRRTSDENNETVDTSEEGNDKQETASKVDPADEKKDNTFDQKHRPQGSLFVELYNVTSPLDAPAGEFQYQGGGWTEGIRLNQINTLNQPVWRLLLTRTNDPNKVDPDDPVNANQPVVDRSVYFADPSALTGTTNDGTRFYPSTATPMAPVLPGRYAVVGPGDPDESSVSNTYFGFETSKDKGESTTRHIELKPNANPNTADQVRVMNNTTSGNELPVAGIQPPVGVIINQPRRLSVSEPRDGWYEPAGRWDSATKTYSPPLDIPLDRDSVNTTFDEPTDRTVIQQTGTVPRFRTVHLQRLANPLEAFDPVNNPYLTVDSHPVDLHVFGGATADDDPQDGGNNSSIVLVSRERGESDTVTRPNLYSQETNPDPDSSRKTTSTVSGHNFDVGMTCSFGFLNKVFGPPRPADPYKGDPTLPFPWLVWNDRPYANVLELLLVPRTRSSQLFNPAYFSLSKRTAPLTSPDQYTPTTYDAANIPFYHLTNYFDSNRWTPAATDIRPQFCRLIEYLHVPSRFAGTETALNPDIAGMWTPAHSGQVPAGSWAAHPFHVPFHTLPNYREPGKINLNTLYSFDVWQGLMNYPSGATTNRLTEFSSFVRSRKGWFVSSGGATLQSIVDEMLRYTDAGASAKPRLRFTNPFRSSVGAYLVPPALNSTGTGWATSADPRDVDREVDATILRADPDAKQKPLFDSFSLQPYDQSERNPYFRYQNLHRLGSLTTTRSNVFAVWITVGLFEAKPVGTNYDAAVYPDGYRLGQELGYDTGEIQRHRGFYIFDRSVPMGFYRGQDINFERGVLVRRFIE